MTPGERFTCELCGQRFIKSRPEADAQVEAKKLWGELPPEEQGVCCEDCFRKIMGALRAPAPPV